MYNTSNALIAKTVTTVIFSQVHFHHPWLALPRDHDRHPHQDLGGRLMVDAGPVDWNWEHAAESEEQIASFLN